MTIPGFDKAQAQYDAAEPDDEYEEEYPDDRDDYAREQAIEDGRMEYER